MIYRTPSPPSRPPPWPRPRRFVPVRAPAPLLSLLLVIQAFTVVALLVAFAGIVVLRAPSMHVWRCGCFPMLLCFVD